MYKEKIIAHYTKNIIILVLLMLPFIITNIVFAELYRYEDERGDIFITDNIDKIPEIYRANTLKYEDGIICISDIDDEMKKDKDTFLELRKKEGYDIERLKVKNIIKIMVILLLIGVLYSYQYIILKEQWQKILVKFFIFFIIIGLIYRVGKPYWQRI